MHIVIIEARYYDTIADNLLSSARKELEAAGAEIEVITVPGAFEIPAAISFYLHTKRSIDGVVTLGCVIRGETSHYDHICDSVSIKLQDLATEHELPLGFGILTCENRGQAEVRADPTQKDYGGKAAKAVLDMIALKQKLGIKQ